MVRLDTFLPTKDNAVTAVIGGLGGCAIVTGLTPFPIGWYGHVLLGVGAFVICSAFSTWAADAKSVGNVIGRQLGAGALVAIALAGVELPFTLWLHESTHSALALAAYIVFGLVCATFTAGPFGAVVSMMFTPLLVIAHNARRAPSLQASTHLLVRGGAWLVGLAMIGALIMTAFWPVDGDAELFLQGVASALIIFTVGLCLFAVGMHRRSARRTWLADVRAGRVDEYRIVDISEVHGDAPSFEHDDFSVDGALVRIGQKRAATYREVGIDDSDELVALVRRQ